jgi:lysophospholipase L1-like esterase
MTETLLALGDSISCGEGVGVLLHRSETWVARTAAALGYEVELLARPGARVRDVRNEQVPVAMAHPARLVTLLIGLNDVIRTGFDAEAVRADLTCAVGRLRRPDRTVLLMRLYDPTLLLPLPKRLRRHFVERVRVINATIEQLRGPGVVVVDLGRVGALRRRGAWAVDRLHPGPVGQHAIAAAGAAALRDAGFTVHQPLPIPSVPRGPTRRAEGRWLVRHGVPWLARHLREVGAPLAGVVLGRAR